MSLADRFLEDIETKISGCSNSERVSILRAITDLFLNGSSQLSEEQVDAFDDVFCRLIDHIEARVLAELSREMATLAAAPRLLVGQLARNGSIEVARPLLTHSNRLQTEDLIEIAATKSQAHLAAIAGRAVVEESVSDLLVSRGDAQVVQIVAGNAGARFSNGGYSTLVTRAGTEEGLAELLTARTDLKPEHLRRIIEKATDTVRRRMLAVAIPDVRAKIESALAEVTAEIARVTPVVAPPRDYAAAERFVATLQHDAAEMRAALRECAEAGKLEYTIALLAALSAIPIPIAERVLTRGHYGGILVLCRAIDVDWTVVAAILTLRDEPGRGNVLASETFFDQFRKLTTPTAQRVVRFWEIEQVSDRCRRTPPKPDAFPSSAGRPAALNAAASSRSIIRYCRAPCCAGDNVVISHLATKESVFRRLFLVVVSIVAIYDRNNLGQC